MPPSPVPLLSPAARAALATLLVALLWPLAAGSAERAERNDRNERNERPQPAPKSLAEPARVIVKYREGSALVRPPPASASLPPAFARHADTMGRRLGLLMTDGHDLGPRMQSLHARGIGAEALAARLAAQPDVEWAEPVRRRHAHGVVPNDPFYAGAPPGATPAAGQWYLRAPDATFVAAIDAVGAWAKTTGSPGVVVAVLDTGVRPEHPDLAGKLLPGYDFISLHAGEPAYYTANDGDGPDSDPQDPGDGVSDTTVCDRAADSSWHGTQTAGIVGAAGDNGIGIVGAGRDVRVLPVRVLGRCGGFDDDILAGMLWAAGLHDSVANPNPARVLNLSLGGPEACSNAYAQAVSRLVAAGVTVVASAGNEGKAVGTPASCPGVVAVAGVRHNGTKVGYSSLGPEVSIAAPAGNCVNAGEPCLYPIVTTSNSGRFTPAASVYTSSFGKYSVGTSFAAPQVAGVVGLMLSADPTLSPERIRRVLMATARPFPVSAASACRPPGAGEQAACYCTTGTCGAGLLDARQAVTAVAAGGQVPPLLAVSASSDTPRVGDPVVLNANASPGGSAAVVSYAWRIVDGSGRAALVGATDTATATLAVNAAGDVTVQVVATDSAGATSTSSKTLYAGSEPVAGEAPAAGGGGALSLLWVALVGLAVAVLHVRLRHPPIR